MKCTNCRLRTKIGLNSLSHLLDLRPESFRFRFQIDDACILLFSFRRKIVFLNHCINIATSLTSHALSRTHMIYPTQSVDLMGSWCKRMNLIFKAFKNVFICPLSSFENQSFARLVSFSIGEKRTNFFIRSRPL